MLECLLPMSLTELDDGLIRRMAIGAVFSDFVRTKFGLSHLYSD